MSGASLFISLSSAMCNRGERLAQQFALAHIDGTEFEMARPKHVDAFIRSQVEGCEQEPSFVFLLADDGLLLAQITAASILRIRADFHGATVSYRRHKGGGKGQMIAKAVGLGAGELPSVLDATAGLGGDAFVLASLGCHLTMTERVPEVRALLEDALLRAEAWGHCHDEALVSIIERMQIIHTDAKDYMLACPVEQRPDVVYLDPMFPVRNKSALVKKEMRVFHDLVGTDPDASELLAAALGCAQKRVVVKRPRIAPTLSTEKPSYALEGKSNRFDVYVCGVASSGNDIE